MTKLAKIEEKRVRGLKEISGRSRFGEVPTPAGWAVVGADALAAYCSQLAWRDPDTLVRNVDGRTLRSMPPREFSAPCFENASNEDPGVPERVPSWVEKDPVLRVLNNKLNFSIFQFIAQWSRTDGHGEEQADRDTGVAATSRAPACSRFGGLVPCRSGVQPPGSRCLRR